jgi:hypothetical protein
MAVPEAAMNEDDRTAPWKDDVGTSWKSIVANPVAEASAVESLPY